MTIRTDLYALINSNLADNNSRAITEEKMRETIRGILDAEMIFQGTYDPAVTYFENDVVFYGQGNWIAKRTGQGVTPVDGPYWQPWFNAGTPGTDGADGTDGATIHYGSADPTNDIGVDGDSYIKTATAMKFFGPKAGGVWPAGISMVGPSGPGTGDMSKATYDPTNINASPFARANQTGTQSADTLTDGTTNKAFLAAERTKLTGISALATQNDTDANLKARANHTGTQSADTLTDGTTNKAFLAAERTKLTGISALATQNDTDANLKARANHTGTQSADTLVDGTTNKAFLAAERTKLTGVQALATQNDTDANLKARANHTGTQTITTISNYGNLPVDPHTGAYVLTAANNGGVVSNTTGGWTLNSGVFVKDQVVTIFNDSGSAQTLTQGSGVQLEKSLTGATGSRTIGAHSFATIVCMGTIAGPLDRFIISGESLT